MAKSSAPAFPLALQLLEEALNARRLLDDDRPGGGVTSGGGEAAVARGMARATARDAVRVRTPCMRRIESNERGGCRSVSTISGCVVTASRCGRTASSRRAIWRVFRTRVTVVRGRAGRSPSRRIRPLHQSPHAPSLSHLGSPLSSRPCLLSARGARKDAVDVLLASEAVEASLPQHVGSPSVFDPRDDLGRGSRQPAVRRYPTRVNYSRVVRPGRMFRAVVIRADHPFAAFSVPATRGSTCAFLTQKCLLRAREPRAGLA